MVLATVLTSQDLHFSMKNGIDCHKFAVIRKLIFWEGGGLTASKAL